MRRDDTTGLRRRVVMLVDNAVDGDSRVQKAARSAADAGWDVTLIGCAHVDAERRWRLGDAEVRVLPLAAARATPPATAPPATAPAVVSRPGGGVPGPEGADVSASGRGAGSRDGSRLRGVSGLRALLVARGGVPLRAARLARRPVEHAQVRYWRARLRDGAWRRLEPGLWDYERVAGPVVDELRPDLIHAHDFRMLGVAARAVERARAAGRDTKLVWDAHEWLPGARPRRDNARWLPAHLGYVREYAGHADAVVTVSDTLADLLVRDHALPERPTVILNAPVTAASEPSAIESTAPEPPASEPPASEPPASEPAAPEPAAFEPADLAAPDLRKRCGLPPDTPLLVYSGAMAVQRGVDTVVEALPLLPGVHLALVVADPGAAYVRQVVARAARHQVADRVHVLSYVPHRQLVAFLAAADIGLIPLHHWPNHEIALITKFFEYAHARLPIVVSDVRTMAETVRATGQGEVFRARDAADLARAVRTVLADPARYRAAYEGPDSPLPGWTWEAQAERLDALYRRLLTPTL
ncbi:MULTISPECIES: glycosyltransferase family 4 protein [unclassified Micromonospora]|uniref:glycosyltransferase family 4 protein n=1 Tax=unclassified Micromonospora TaxID=2617518 RepID=UPI001C22FF41|nr:MULTISPECIES: glycosyltransferase family 4 protein [unclassified Micromonospora]MBU8860506.1 glycosyltransferase family 4 protein [Micromonospora sp. WMMB482]MDM4780043.1 glycosyltransferase family 4 protein [Micromonospora sp. b486]